MNYDSDAFARVLDRARGVLYGQVIGDNLGALVEFRSAAEIAERYPDGVRELADGGTHGIAAGQPTDDSEMALALARSLARREGYDTDDVRESYVRWANSDAFDIGQATTAALLRRAPNPNSQANGALMRISPLAIAYWSNPARAGEFARTDAAITHPHPFCVEANARFASALADVISGGFHQPRRGIGISALMEWLDAQSKQWLSEWQGSGAMLDSGQPDFSVHQGWVRLALWALHEELHLVKENTTTFEDSLVRVIGRGGDTDTNAAIVGAFLGGIFGASAIPQRWRDVIDSCSPLRNRPVEYHPNDVAQLAGKLAELSL
ncbi:MAG: ADP-ribosylglycohydrolase family protein [Corynebacterium sp.]|uniref:ADP-ribosylglycohydrolase family protein n=1 Tax=Corynebacterium sp. TaxID=1720 RepID=UPI0026DBE099|nr:ADP-ribosylglycohydrolase family protein [Corynebacterium sp.]MDO5030850.1 ADP-ribosylglycohydrolase family protein [Corynebacterium sp.]